MKRGQRGVISRPLVACVALILLAPCWKNPEIVAGGMDARGGNPARPNILFISIDDLNDLSDRAKDTRYLIKTYWQQD